MAGRWWSAAALALLPSVAASAHNAPEWTITVSDTFIGAACAGVCISTELGVRSDGELVVRRFDPFARGRLIYESHLKVGAERIEHFRELLSTIRPAGTLQATRCDAVESGSLKEIRWQGDGAPFRIIGCLTSNIACDNHIICARNRATLALGLEPFFLEPVRHPDPSELKGCEIEGFEELVSAEASPFSASGIRARQLRFSTWCQRGCQRYAFMVDSRGLGFFDGRGDYQTPARVAFTVTPAEFAAFNAALATYRERKHNVHVISHDDDCRPGTNATVLISVSWSDRYDAVDDEAQLSDGCGDPARFRALFDAPRLLPELVPLIAAATATD